MTPRPLTLAEAQRRSALLRVESYVVDLDLTRGESVLGSRVVVRFGCNEVGATTFAELVAHRLVSATLNGRALPAAAYDGGRLTLDALAAENELVVEAEVAYTSTGDGMHRYVDPSDGEAYVGAYVGVVNAQLVFANFDQPDLKATISTRVTAPLGWTVVGNGPAVSGSPADGRWELATTPRLSTYLFVVVAGPLHVVETEHRGLPFFLTSRRSLSTALDENAPEILEITTACFDRYAELFDEPYPFASYGQAFVPELNWGALEQPGAILFRDEMLFTSAVTAQTRLSRANTIAHEMAHMWFGDLVTMRWWDDLWLSESFAEYMGSRILVDATRFGDAWTWFLLDRKTWGYDADERRSTHPVAPAAADVLDTESAFANFDGISYAKGAAALRQLVAWVGDDVFLAGINDLLATRAFGTAALGDVLDALDRRSERDVHAWARDWLRTTGVDTIRVARDGHVVSVTHPGLRPHLVSLGSYDLLADGTVAIRRRHPVRLDPGDRRTLVDLGAGPEPVAVLLDDTDLTWAKVRHDDATTEALGVVLAGIPDPMARATAWVSWRDRVRDAELDPRDHLALVARHLVHEANPIVVDAVLRFARHELVDRYLDPGARESALHELRATTRALLGRADADDDLRLVAAHWMVDSVSAPGADVLRGWLRDGVPGAPRMDDDLRWRVLRRLAVLGATDLVEIDRALAEAPDEEAALHAAWSRAALPDAAAKARAWELVMLGDTASTYVVRATLEGFWQPEQHALLAPYVDAYFPAALAVAARRGPAVAQVVGGRGFPFHHVDAAVLTPAERCVADPSATVPLRRAVADRVDDYRRALAVRARWS